MDIRIVNSNRESTPFFKKFIAQFHTELHTGMRAIVLGAGRYRHCRELKKAGMKHVLAVDFFSFPNDLPMDVDFIQHDLEKGLPFLNNAVVDVLVSIFVVEFIRHRELLFAEIERVTKEGAFLVLMVNPKPLTHGYPIDLDEWVNRLTGQGKWVILSKFLKSKQRGYVLQKIKQQPLVVGVVEPTPEQMKG